MSALAEWELLLALPIDRALPWAERERRKDRVPAPAQVGGRAGICSGEAEAGLRVLFDLMAARQSQATRRAAGQPPGCAFGLSDGLGEGLLAPQGGAQDVAFGSMVPVVLWPRLPHLSDGGKRSAVASGVQSLPGRVAPGLASWAGCPGWERPSMLRRHSSGPRRGGWLPNAGLLVWRAAGPLGGSRELGCARPRALALSGAPQPCLPSRLSLALLCAGRRVRGPSPGAADLRSVWVVAAFGLGPRAEGCWWIPRLLSRPQEQALGLQGVGGCRGDSPANPCRASPRCTQVERRKDLSPTAAASGQRRAGCGWERQAKGQARCSWSLCPPDGARARAEPPAHAAARGVLWLRRRLGDGWGDAQGGSQALALEAWSLGPHGPMRLDSEGRRGSAIPSGIPLDGVGWPEDGRGWQAGCVLRACPWLGGQPTSRASSSRLAPGTCRCGDSARRGAWLLGVNAVRRCGGVLGGGPSLTPWSFSPEVSSPSSFPLHLPRFPLCGTRLQGVGEEERKTKPCFTRGKGRLREGVARSLPLSPRGAGLPSRPHEWGGCCPGVCGVRFLADNERVPAPPVVDVLLLRGGGGRPSCWQGPRGQGRAGIPGGKQRKGRDVLFERVSTRRRQSPRRAPLPLAPGPPLWVQVMVAVGLGEGQGGSQGLAFGSVVPRSLWARVAQPQL